MTQHDKSRPRDPVTGEEIPEEWRNYTCKQILQARHALWRMKVGVTPWKGWCPGSGKEYDPNDSHFNPFHPPRGYPRELLEKEWGEKFDDEEDGGD